MQSNYHIVEAKDVHVLVGKVASNIKEGWQAFGNPMVTPDGYGSIMFYQAMVKEESVAQLVPNNERAELPFETKPRDMFYQAMVKEVPKSPVAPEEEKGLKIPKEEPKTILDSNPELMKKFEQKTRDNALSDRGGEKYTELTEDTKEQAVGDAVEQSGTGDEYPTGKLGEGSGIKDPD